MDWGEVWKALIIGAPAAALGYLAFRRSQKVDSVSEQSGIATQASAGIAQIQSSLNDLVDSLQEDNKAFREDIKYLTARLDACNTERDQMRIEIARLKRKYGENGPV